MTKTDKYKSQLTVFIDRLEEDVAVLEMPDRKTVNFPLRFLPSEAKEGMCFQVIFQRDKEEEDKLRQEIADLEKELLG